jgi:apolipoprotein N-acyltransferase
MIKKTDILLSIVSGLLLVPAFPPIDFFPFAWVALVPLLIALNGKDAKSAFCLGMIFGFVYFAGTIYWISNSMRVYGNIPVLVTLFAISLLCTYLALYAGVFSMLFNFLKERYKLPASIIAPLLWVPLEFLRSYALTGFPWSILGYTQYSFLTLIQISDITGIYGISFLVVAINGMLFDVYLYKSEKTRHPLTARWPMTLSILLMTAVITGVLFYGRAKLNVEENEQKIKVSVIQGNIPQDRKWDSKFQTHVIDKYEKLTREAAAANPDIIIWPESALPFIFGHDKVLTGEVVDFQKQLDSYLIFGGLIGRGSEQGKSRLANSAFLLSPEGTVESVYDKMLLVPFGEYVPMRKLLPFIDKMVMAIGDFVPGREHVVMNTPFAKIGNLICYEIIFPGFVRKFVDRGANVLVTITNDAWFGRTAGPYQNFSVAVFRAIENRVPVVRSANTGISGFIDTKGRIENKSDIFVEANLTGDVAIGKDRSFYTKYGDIFDYACLLGSVLLIVNGFFPERKE